MITNNGINKDRRKVASMRFGKLLAFALIVVCMALLPGRAASAGQYPAPDNHPVISAEELSKRIEKGEKVIILDVRNEGQYKSSSKRIPGDIRIDRDSDFDTKLKDLPRDSQVVAYCT
jgi:hypothetical protein